MNFKRVLIFSIFLNIGAVSIAHAVTIGPVVLYPDSPSAKDPRPFNVREASKYCKSLGMRVPIARELAEWAITRGATGIRETKFPGTTIPYGPQYQEISENQSDGYLAVYGDSAGSGLSSVDFYFNPTGYQRSPEFGPAYASLFKYFLTDTVDSYSEVTVMVDSSHSS